MKNRFAVCSTLAFCLFAIFVVPTWAADPGARYSDAFILIQQAQTAEEKSDHATAYQRYQEALDILHGIRTDSPNWNGQMVEYRLKDCQSHLDAVKAQLPAAVPPAAIAERSTVVTPAVTLSSAEPAPAPLPVTTPAPVMTSNDQSAKLRGQLDKLQKENDQLKSDVAEAKRSAKSNAQLDKLARENKDLKDQLVASEKKAVPAESPELKKLRADLDKARAEATTAKTAASQVTELQKQNKDLSAQLESAKKQVSAKVTPVVAAPTADTAELRKLRADADSARADAEKARRAAADQEKKTAELNAQIASAKKQAADAADSRSAELKKTHADLDMAHTEVADLKKQVAAKSTSDSAEVKDLRAQLAESHKDLDQAKKSAGEVTTLQRQNKDLIAQLDAAKKDASAKVTPVAAAPVSDSAELKKLRADADSSRADADKARKTVADLEKQNADLSSKLSAEKQVAVSATTAEPSDVRIMKHLRNENSYLRNLLDTYAAQNTELKGQLHRHDQSQSKNTD
jgi:chromosome segregation ATPase